MSSPLAWFWDHRRESAQGAAGLTVSRVYLCESADSSAGSGKTDADISLLIWCASCTSLLTEWEPQMSLKQGLKEHFKDELHSCSPRLEKCISVTSIGKQVYKCLGLGHTEQRPSAHEAAVLECLGQTAVLGTGGVLLHPHIPLHPAFRGRTRTPAPLTCLLSMP